MNRLLDLIDYSTLDLTNEKHTYKHIDYPLNPGGHLLISANGDAPNDYRCDSENEDRPAWQRSRKDGFWRLDFSAIQNGLDVMARDYRRHFDNFIDESDDGTTADVFLQCCLFGKVVFG